MILPTFKLRTRKMDDNVQYSTSFQSKWANISPYQPDTGKLKPSPTLKSTTNLG